MKTIALPVLASLSLTTSLFALPDYEPFADATSSGGTTYTVGAPLTNQINAQGLGWFQAGATNFSGTIRSGNLAVTGLNPPIGNSVLMTPTNNVAARFAIGAQIASGSIYYSFTLRVPDVGTTLGTGGGFIAGFNNTGAASQANSPTIVGARTLLRSATGGFNIGLSKASSTASDFAFGASPTLFTTSDTIFVVASYDFGALATQGDDSSRMWINPDPTTFGSNSPPAATLTASTGNDVITSGSIQSFLLYARPNNLFPNQLIVDELYVGTSWADVTPTGPRITGQPQPQRALVGGTASVSVSAVGAAGYQWRFNGNYIPGAVGASLNLNNAQISDSGSYTVVVTNGSVSVTSSVATLSVIPDIYPRLRPLWSIAPQTTNYPFVTVDGSNFPNQRSFAFNALSNQVLLVSRTNSVTGDTNPVVYVLDPSTGTNLYTMDTTGVSGGTAGSPPLYLVGIDVADDGAVYAANVASGTTIATATFEIYRWADSSPGVPPTKVYNNYPDGFSSSPRWGDAIRVRGAGINTEIIADSNQDNQANKWFDIFTPTDSAMTTFDHNPCPVQTNFYPTSTIGRSLQFGESNSVWMKRKGAPLQLATYTNVAFDSMTVITNFSNWPSSVGPVAFALGSNLLCAVDFSSSSSTPDTLDLFEISDLSLPVLLAKYNFPTNHQANVNNVAQILLAGTNVIALDGNNGIAAFTWVPFRPSLNITPSGANVLISWVTNATGYTLYSTPTLTNPATWTSEGAGTIVGASYVVTNSANAASKFYRLQQ